MARSASLKVRTSNHGSASVRLGDLQRDKEDGGGDHPFVIKVVGRRFAGTTCHISGIGGEHGHARNCDGER